MNRYFLLFLLLFPLVGSAGQAAAPAGYETVDTRYVDTLGIRFAYRVVGREGRVPLVLLNHSRGTLDSWDPLLVDELAKERRVVVFDNAGVGGSSGKTPADFSGMSRDAIIFLRALKFNEVDLLGFSIGGCVAQEMALAEPTLIRRLVLAGTAPKGGEDIMLEGKTLDYFTQPPSPAEGLLFLFFAPSETSQAAGRAFLQRRQARKDRVPPASTEAARAQREARDAWGQPQPALYERLGQIKQPVLVANGSDDIMMQTKNSFILSEHLPNATLVIYPDSGHGFLFQHAKQFAGEVNRFLGHWAFDR